MGLQGTIETGIATAFSAAGDLTSTATLHRRTRNDFDENVLRPVIEYTNTIIDEVIVTSFNSKELNDRGILPFDKKVLIQGVDINNTSPIPEDDQITIDGDLLNIKSVKALPKNVLIILQVRAIE